MTVRAYTTRGWPLRERFLHYSSPEPNSGCWLWTGTIIEKGYGRLCVNGKTVLATHVSLELDGRPRPGAQFCALHTCDNPSCVNPEHLYWGTIQDNSNDMVARGRSRGKVYIDFCSRGHDLNKTRIIEKNGTNRCRICRQDEYRRRRANG